MSSSRYNRGCLNMRAAITILIYHYIIKVCLHQKVLLNDIISIKFIYDPYVLCTLCYYIYTMILIVYTFYYHILYDINVGIH